LILQNEFYQRTDVVQIAKELLGKFLVTNFDGAITSGMIVETEAYAGIRDKASHAWNGRFTNRTKIMYQQGGTAYIYLCYGVHSLFNIVTNKAGIPDAVLIRGILPEDGKDIMLHRKKAQKITADFGIGPGKVSQILGIHYSQSGVPVTFPVGDVATKKPLIWVENRGNVISDSEIITTPRIGVDYAGEDAALPWRFILKQ
jgi:DNA-3-methyladenine glycosylase